VSVVASVLVSCTHDSSVPSPPEAARDSETGVSTTAPATGEWFANVGSELGIDFVHDPGPPGDYFMPEVIGSGLALIDVDGDGRLDLYFLQNAGTDSTVTHRLYRQLENGRFADISRGSGLDVRGRGMGAAVGDLDNDGRDDILLTEYQGVRLFRNEGGGTFSDRTAAAGIDNPHWGTSAAFFDYDRDGLLDVIVANYVVFSPTRPCTDQGGRRDYCGPQPFPGTVARLFRNTGGFRFEDTTIPSGIAGLPGPGLGVLCADFDGDRWPDVFVANDGEPNRLWMNQRDGRFRDEAIVRGVALSAMGVAQADMGIAFGDVGGDGLFDLYVTHLTDETHALFAQGPPGQFSESTALRGLTRTEWRATGFGTVLADFDNDGDLDLAQANGRVKFIDGPSPAGESFWSVYRERHQLLEGAANGSFRDISRFHPALCGSPGIGRGLAVGDLDGDGGLDLIMSEIAAPPRVLRNVVATRGHWVRIRAVDPELGGRIAYGSEVRVLAAGRQRSAWVQPGYSYLSSNDPRVHFGLGAATEFDSVVVLWPDGSEESFDGGTVDRELRVEKGRGVPRVREEVRR
jgi:hypothetical protein